jgi:hypothetical protein
LQIQSSIATAVRYRLVSTLFLSFPLWIVWLVPSTVVELFRLLPGPRKADISEIQKGQALPFVEISSVTWHRHLHARVLCFGPFDGSPFAGRSFRGFCFWPLWIDRSKRSRWAAAAKDPTPHSFQKPAFPLCRASNSDSLGCESNSECDDLKWKCE